MWLHGIDYAALSKRHARTSPTAGPRKLPKVQIKKPRTAEPVAVIGGTRSCILHAGLADRARFRFTGAMNDRAHQQTLCVDQGMSLLAFDLFACIKQSASRSPALLAWNPTGVAIRAGFHAGAGQSHQHCVVHPDRISVVGDVPTTIVLAGSTLVLGATALSLRAGR